MNIFEYMTLICFVCYFIDKVHSKSKVRQFPKNFLFGVSSSAYQIEGGWQEDGKGPSIWDIASHTDPSPIQDGSSGDVAADSYHLYKKDAEIAQELGITFYKFSISWSRILPYGFADRINANGIKYYENLIDELVSRDIQPVVTIYHFDLPNNLQKLGGWVNPTIIDVFVDYAKVLFDKFGGKVKHWITIDDPKGICYEGYGSTAKAPTLNMTGIGEYLCAKHVLIAHAKVYHMYDEKYRKLHGGIIGISIGFVWYDPASDSVEDHQAATDARMFEWGQYAHPIFTIGGDFPRELKINIGLKSAEQGYPRSRLPILSAQEVTLIRGSADFLGVNTYTTKLAYRDASLEGMYTVPSYMDDMGSVLVKDPTWTQSAANWLQHVPWGFYKLLMEIKLLYDNPPVYITGNGWATAGGLLDDDRIDYMRTYLSALLNALDEGCLIKGYYVWSLIDSFEWFHGYTTKFGLYEVDFDSAEKIRTPRKSSYFYKQIVATKTLDPDYEPEKFLVKIPERVET